MNPTIPYTPQQQWQPETPSIMGSIYHMIPKPWNLRHQVRAIGLNYLWRDAIWANAMESGLKWQGVWGTRWLAGGGIRGIKGAVGIGPLGQGFLGRAAAAPGQFLGKIATGVVKSRYGNRAAVAFSQRGAKGLLEYMEWSRYKNFIKNGGEAANYATKYTNGLMYKIMRFLSGGSESTLFKVKGTDKAAKTVLTTKGAFARAEGVGFRGFGEAATGIEVGSKVMKGAMIATRAVRIASWWMLAAQLGFTGGKYLGKFVEKKMAQLASALHSISQSDVYLAPQLANKYSMSMRQMALREINNSAFNPRNQLLGREAELMHR